MAPVSVFPHASVSAHGNNGPSKAGSRRSVANIQYTYSNPLVLHQLRLELTFYKTRKKKKRIRLFWQRGIFSYFQNLLCLCQSSTQHDTILHLLLCATIQTICSHL